MEKSLGKEHTEQNTDIRFYGWRQMDGKVLGYVFCHGLDTFLMGIVIEMGKWENIHVIY